MYCRISLQVFGYASIRREEVDNLKVDMRKASEEYGWHVVRHTMVYGILMDKKGDGSYMEIPYVVPKRTYNKSHEPKME